MKFVRRSAFVAGLVVCALGGISSASASAALPEFAPEGASFPIAVSGASTEATGLFSAIGGSSLLPKCRGYKVSGQITGAKAVSLTLELTKCLDNYRECNTKGAAAQHIALPGKGTLAYIEKATGKVGVVLTLPVIEVSCEGFVILLKAPVGIVTPITPLNVTTSKVDLTLHGEKGKQEYRSYENEKSELVTEASLETFTGATYSTSALAVSGEIALSVIKPIKIIA